MINNENQNNAIKEKLNFFYNEKIAVHISKHNREFLNGSLVERKTDNIFVINDRNKGLISVFVSEIFDVEEFREGEK